MTQLIDKKAVLEAVKALPAELDAETVQRCIEVLSNQPTVEAIPTAWILDWIQYMEQYYGYYTGIIHAMLEDWRTERNE